MKNCCALCSLLIALFVLTGSLQAQTQMVNTKATTTVNSDVKNCDPSKCDVTKCTPKQVAACKATCKKMAATSCNKNPFSLASLVSNETEKTTKKASCQPAQCTAKQKAACKKMKSASVTKTSQLAEADANTATKEMK